MAVVARRRALVKISGRGGSRYWSGFTGGNKSKQGSRFYNGGSKSSDVVMGRGEIGNITLTQGWDPKVDLPLSRQLWQDMEVDASLTVTVQYLDGNGSPSGQPLTYTDSKVLSVNTPDYDEQSTDAATWTVELMPGNLT